MSAVVASRPSFGRDAGLAALRGLVTDTAAGRQHRVADGLMGPDSVSMVQGGVLKAAASPFASTGPGAYLDFSVSWKHS